MAPATIVPPRDLVLRAKGAISTVVHRPMLCKLTEKWPSGRKISGNTKAPKIAVGTKVSQVVNHWGKPRLVNSSIGKERGI